MCLPYECLLKNHEKQTQIYTFNIKTANMYICCLFENDLNCPTHQLIGEQMDYFHQ